MYFDTLGVLEARRNIAVLFNVRKVINFQQFQKKTKTTTANTCCYSPQKKIQSNVHPRIRKETFQNIKTDCMYNGMEEITDGT